MKKKIAVHRNILESELIGDESWGEYSTYVAVTEYVEVDFPDLDAKEFVPKQVASLKGMKDELQEKYLRESAAIDEQISKLTAITHQTGYEDA